MCLLWIDLGWRCGALSIAGQNRQEGKPQLGRRTAIVIVAVEGVAAAAEEAKAMVLLVVVVVMATQVEAVVPTQASNKSESSKQDRSN